MYTVIGNTQSRTFRVLWALEELGLPYTHIPANPQSDAVRANSPLGKVPVLLDGDTAIPDSTAIMTYLADKHGRLTAPAGTLERAQQDALTFRILDELDALLWTAARHSFILAEDMRVPDVKPSLKKEFARNLDRLVPEIKGPFLTGDTLSIPDIILGHCAGWARTAKFPDASPEFVAYLKNLRSLSSFERAAKK
ncbi:Glutathione S-transferase zeta class [Nymphon striatum]|nr:Glutathione S-transferase zeta class [Nymphon striatum]